MRKPVCLFVALTALCACGGQFGGDSESNLKSFSIALPEGWRKVSSSKDFIITKEDAFSQYIFVQRRHIDQPFRHTEKKFNKAMLPQDAAEVILDEISSDAKVLNFRLIESVPARVSRYDGFKIVFAYKEKGGLKFKTILYGLLEGDWFYGLRYNAQQKKYSDEDLETFKRVVNSFKIVGDQSA